MASSLFNPRALQSFSTICLQVFFGLPLTVNQKNIHSAILTLSEGRDVGQKIVATDTKVMSLGKQA